MEWKEKKKEITVGEIDGEFHVEFPENRVINYCLPGCHVSVAAADVRQHCNSEAKINDVKRQPKK